MQTLKIKPVKFRQENGKAPLSTLCLIKGSGIGGGKYWDKFNLPCYSKNMTFMCVTKAPLSTFKGAVHTERKTKVSAMEKCNSQKCTFSACLHRKIIESTTVGLLPCFEWAMQQEVASSGFNWLTKTLKYNPVMSHVPHTGPHITCKYYGQFLSILLWYWIICTQHSSGFVCCLRQQFKLSQVCYQFLSM